KKIGPDPRNFNQRVSLGRNDLLIRTFLSHNMSDVEKICDRVIWIENHRLREVGSADRIIELYKQAMA
ncbi:hypothetical protein ACVXN0_27550, partial [Klebsiella pneumoniae]